MATEYQQKLELDIRKDYKKVGKEIVDDIDSEAAKFANNFKLDDRIEGMALKPSLNQLLTNMLTKLEFPMTRSVRRNGQYFCLNF